MTFFQSIVYKIARKFGLELAEKPVITSDYSTVTDISLTATIANRVATLTMMDSNIIIKGSTLRAEYLEALWNDSLIDKLDTACEVALGTGDCLLKPYTDGDRVGVDIIPNGNFFVCEACDDFIKSCIFKCETIRRAYGPLYERFEVHRLRTVEVGGITVSATFIYQLAFKDGIEIDISEVSEWSQLEPVTVIPNVNQLLFGRIKCPTVNRQDINSSTGVPITYGLDGVMRKAVAAYNRLNEEFERKEAFIFADKTLFKKDKETGEAILPQGKKRLFMLFPRMTDSQVGGQLIDTYSPDIRSEEMVEGLEQNFKMLEMLAGLSNGVLTAPTTNFATATEVKASLSLTFAYMTKFRRSITKGVRQLIKAIDILCNVNNITPIGDYTLTIDWSSAYIESLTEQYSRLLEAYKLGAVDLAEVRAWLMDENVELAKEKVQAILQSRIVSGVQGSTTPTTPSEGEG